MVSKGAVAVLYGLSTDQDTITLHYIASAIIRLASQNTPRLINDGGVISICNIANRCPTLPNTTQLCAAALQLLSRQNMNTNKQNIVQEGCIPALVTLLRESKDNMTLRQGLAAISNLLTAEENHVPMIQQGGVQSVIQLCDHESSDIQEACALALFNLSRGESTRDHQINQHSIPAIIALS